MNLPDETAEPGRYVFRSALHPGAASRAVIFGRAVVGPLAFCMTPVMVLTLIAVLGGLSVLSFLYAAFPAAIFIAWWWTVYRLKSDIAELHVSGGKAAVRTRWNVLTSKPRSRWLPILDLRVHDTAMYVALGDTMREFERSTWPEFSAMADALRHARAISRETMAYVS